ncbi:UDP-N-acetylmuramoyl-L-alanine--D-glutamate ligase [Aliagarivorans taiwanensis]|uniref:UDP-N-acetylmuramoyl-L-alanine--D-glutamate ligase n=1 Tax=Aliagarivorans taiwanensis TaxID=561966 RepID=UPI00040746C6|nr:UDP-N-acetylmuramoyl-L-alanine--D-glutamate ligase [Aliagarivorans taiwanensis]
MQQLNPQLSYVVIGLGQTGLSCVRFLLSKGVTPFVCDTRASAPGADQLPADVALHCGPLDEQVLAKADVLIVSPGIALSHPVLQAMAEQGKSLIGDVEVFCWYAKAPVIAITGSNGKSTVTSLVGEMAKQAGRKVEVAGNIGIPVLDVVDDSVELYVLELSSFQLETTHSLRAAAATLLNLSEDHMDRYEGLADYAAAKQVIYQGAQLAVVNLDDDQSAPSTNVSTQRCFSIERSAADYALIDGQLVVDGEAVVSVDALQLVGEHNYANALAALALADAVALPHAAAIEALKRYQGLAHRSQLVSRKLGKQWINDSKATNVGATLAALQGMRKQAAQLWLIVGGDSKQGELDALQAPFAQLAGVVAFGRDKARFKALHPATELVDDLSQALSWCHNHSQTGDTIMLSPACASLDMYPNFEKRGEHFAALVEAL